MNELLISPPRREPNLQSELEKMTSQIVHRLDLLVELQIQILKELKLLAKGKDSA